MSNALAIVQKAQANGALVFVNTENFESQVDLYRTEVTTLLLTEKDFHNIQGKYMPTKAVTDRIGEASGVEFVQSACRVIAETRDDPLCGKRTAYRAEAQGKVRMPDGSWRHSTVDEYEWDPTLRAMLDKNVVELTDATRKIVGRTILEYTKVGRQRAATGARLRVIRQLTGMPSAFEKVDIQRPFVFTRIVQNTSYILQTPEGRAMSTAQALGVDVASIFGGKKTALTASPEQVEPPAQGYDDPPPDTSAVGSDTASLAAQATEPDFDDPDDTVPPNAETEFDRLTVALEEFVAGYKAELNVTTSTGKNPYTLAEAELANKDATEDSRRGMIDRLRKFLLAKGVAA
jgi:hypothetical protein